MIIKTIKSIKINAEILYFNIIIIVHYNIVKKLPKINLQKTKITDLRSALGTIIFYNKIILITEHFSTERNQKNLKIENPKIINRYINYSNFKISLYLIEYLDSLSQNFLLGTNPKQQITL